MENKDQDLFTLKLTAEQFTTIQLALYTVEHDYQDRDYAGLRDDLQSRFQDWQKNHESS